MDFQTYLIPFFGEVFRAGDPLLLHVNQARVVVIGVMFFKAPVMRPWISVFSVFVQRDW